MTDTSFLTTPQGRRIAYDRVTGAGPGVVFLHGLRSDMEGTKAVHLAAWARRSGRAFLRFDCSGHGKSSGRFEEGAIGDWFADALAAVAALTEGPQVLVGSSMGGWLALLLARAVPGRVKGLVGIAAAPDFTEDSMWADTTPEQRGTLMRDGVLHLPSDYSDEPYVITRRLIEDGRDHLVLRSPLPLPFPVRLLHGTADRDVPVSVARRLLDHADCPDMRLTLIKDADHRFSSPACLAAIEAAVSDVS
jgi:pimeloyl-ACP methyl ester carboxylesterase